MLKLSVWQAACSRAAACRPRPARAPRPARRPRPRPARPPAPAAGEYLDLRLRSAPLLFGGARHRKVEFIKINDHYLRRAHDSLSHEKLDVSEALPAISRRERYLILRRFDLSGMNRIDRYSKK